MQEEEYGSWNSRTGESRTVKVSWDDYKRSAVLEPPSRQCLHKTELCPLILRRPKQVCNEDTVRTACFALFDHLRYGLTVWGSSSKGNLRRVLILQKKAIHLLSGLGPQESCRNTFKSLNIVTNWPLHPGNNPLSSRKKRNQRC
uniref:Uncharacterized protein n=1 Tax=Graphocephala atropunctata TaxID=36148 RepID=A0A1B6LIV5_9HEMI